MKYLEDANNQLQKAKKIYVEKEYLRVKSKYKIKRAIGIIIMIFVILASIIGVIIKDSGYWGILGLLCIPLLLIANGTINEEKERKIRSEIEAMFEAEFAKNNAGQSLS